MVCQSVCHTSDHCKNGCTDQDAIWVEDSGGPREPCIGWGSRSPREGEILRGKGATHCKVYGHSAVICAKTAKLIKMQFGLWARMDRRNRVLDGDPEVLMDIAVATNFGTKIAIDWLCVNDSD